MIDLKIKKNNFKQANVAKKYTKQKKRRNMNLWLYLINKRNADEHHNK